MLYGAIAASKIRPPLETTARFSAIGNLLASATISENTIKQGAATFAGVGSLSSNASLSNPILQGIANFSGAGQLTADGLVSNPLWQGSASFAGAGNLVAPAFTCLAGTTVADWEFDENGGGTAVDIIAGNNGTLVGSPTWVTGKTGYALSFNGTSQSVTVSTFDPIPTNTTGSISVWVKPSDFSNAINHYVIAKGDDTSNQSWGLDLIGNGTSAAVYIIYYDFSIAAYYTGAVIPNDGNFHHVVAIYGPSAATKIYVDNTDESLSTLGSPPANMVSNAALPFNIAKTSRASPNTYFYAGAIDNLKIFNRALTAGEVSRLYNYP